MCHGTVRNGHCESNPSQWKRTSNVPLTCPTTTGIPDRIHSLRDPSSLLKMSDKNICGILSVSFQKVFTIELQGKLPYFADRTEK